MQVAATGHGDPERDIRTVTLCPRIAEFSSARAFEDMAAALNTNIAITERFLTSSDGTIVFAQAAGNSNLPTLVFIHGMALSTLVWARILQDVHLLKSFHLVSPLTAILSTKKFIWSQTGRV